jgi:hypothetical protein
MTIWRSVRRRPSPLAGALLLGVTLACGSDGPTDPPDAVYGETTVVYVMNPVVNGVNAVAVPARWPMSATRSVVRSSRSRRR